jgi:hypothetical protein
MANGPTKGSRDMSDSTQKLLVKTLTVLTILTLVATPVGGMVLAVFKADRAYAMAEKNGRELEFFKGQITERLDTISKEQKASREVQSKILLAVSNLVRGE